MSSSVRRAGPPTRTPKASGRGCCRDTHHIFVEVVHHHPGQARVTPVAVHEQQLLEVPEAGDGEVAGHDGLGGQSRHESFLPWLPRTLRGGLCSGPAAGRV